MNPWNPSRILSCFYLPLLEDVGLLLVSCPPGMMMMIITIVIWLICIGIVLPISMPYLFGSWQHAVRQTSSPHFTPMDTVSKWWHAQVQSLFSPSSLLSCTGSIYLPYSRHWINSCWLSSCAANLFKSQNSCSHSDGHLIPLTSPGRKRRCYFSHLKSKEIKHRKWNSKQTPGVNSVGKRWLKLLNKSCPLNILWKPRKASHWFVSFRINGLFMV